MTRLGLMLFFMAAAIACYAQGAATGIAVFIGLGVVLELGFWFGLYDYMPKTDKRSK